MSQANDLRAQFEDLLTTEEGRAKVEKALTVVDRPEIDAPAQWGDREQVIALALRFRTMLPKGHELSLAQTMAAAQHAMLTGLNPFRGEVYYYPGKGGTLAIVDGYKALTREASLECAYDEIDVDMPLGPGELHHVKVTIFRHDRREQLEWYRDKGADFQTAFDLVSKSAVGVVTEAEVKKVGDPPQGWTWRQVAYKRALKTALNLSHNMPSIEDLARRRLANGGTHPALLANGEETQAGDWADQPQAVIEAGPAVQEQHAAMTARDRKAQHDWASLTPEAQQARAAEASRILYGDPDFEGFGDDTQPDVVDGEVIDPPPEEDMDPLFDLPPLDDGYPEPAASASEVQKFLEAVNNEIEDKAGDPFYKHVNHLSNALALHLGPSFTYPPASDLRKWDTLKSLAVQHGIRELAKQKGGNGGSDTEGS